MISALGLLSTLSLLMANFADGSSSHDRDCLNSESLDYVCTAGSETISLSGCSVANDDIPDLVACFDNVGRSGITHVYFGSYPEWLQLTEMPEDLFAGFVNLVTLSISWTELESVPAGLLSGLEMLEELNVEDIGLPALPAGFLAGLKNLKILNLSYNYLMELPADLFSDLEMVVDLNLKENQLTELPSGTFSGLTSLDRLYISNNNLATLASDVFSPLETLTQLWLSSNKLTVLPADIFLPLENLDILKLSNNDDLVCLPATTAESITLSSGVETCELVESPTPAPVGGGTCSNGVAGVEGFDQCCALECGTCGGKGCKDGAQSAGLSADDCCAGRIRDSGVMCDVSGTAPCTIVAGDNPPGTCSNNLAGVQGFGMCCVLECGTCGRKGCKDRAEAAGLTADDCCVGRISDSDVMCDASGTAPCII